MVDATGRSSFTLTVDHASAAHSLVVNSSAAKVEILSGGTLTLGGNLVIDAGTFQIDAGGVLKEIATGAKIIGSFTDNGTVEVGAGATLEVTSTSISGHGSFKIDAGATLPSDHADSLNVVFSGSGTLVLKDPVNFHGTVSDSGTSLTPGDVLDLKGFDVNAHIHYDPGAKTVTDSEGNTQAVIHVGANSGNWSLVGADADKTGILIHDPPTDNGLPAPNQIWASDGFLFKPDAGPGPDSDHGPWADPALAEHWKPAAGVASLDEVGGDTAADPNQTVDPAGLDNLKAVLAAHHNEFHFV